MKIISILAAALLCGCTHITYKDSSGRAVSSTSLLTNKGPTEIVFIDGDKLVRVNLAYVDQSKGVSDLKELVGLLPR